MENNIEITIEQGAGEKTVSYPPNTPVSTLIDDGHLRPESQASTRVNGAPAMPSTTLREGDVVEQVKRSGTQG